MKTLFVSLVALLFAFFLGCQNSITDPEMSESTQFVGNAQEDIATYKDFISFTYPNVIKLSGTLLDPNQSIYNQVKISGVVRYGIKKINTGTNSQIPVAHYKSSPNETSTPKYKVDFYLDAAFKSNDPHCNRTWSAKGTADQIFVTNSLNNAVVSFVKSFRVKNTCYSPLYLVLRFEFSEKELRLVSMDLQLAPGQLPIVVQQ